MLTRSGSYRSIDGGSADPKHVGDFSCRCAGLLYLAAVAAGISENHEKIVAELLDALGWMSGDGSPITARSAAGATSEVRDMLRRMGLLQRGGSVLDRRELPTRNAVDFARAALTAWPR